MSVGIKPESGLRLIDGDFINGLAAGQNMASTSGIVARAGGGQANATQLPSTYLIEVDTVATAADSVKLPFAYVGTELTIINPTANSLNVFANDAINRVTGSQDTINALANGTALAVAAGAVTIFACAKDGKWYAK